MATILIRDVDDHIVQSLNEMAKARGLSREELLRRIISRTVEAAQAEKDELIGFVTLSRWRVDNCAACGEFIDGADVAYMGVTPDGWLVGPFCDDCARSGLVG